MKLEVFIALFTEIHWLLLNIITTIIEVCIIPVHQSLYACVMSLPPMSGAMEPLPSVLHENFFLPQNTSWDRRDESHLARGQGCRKDGWRSPILTEATDSLAWAVCNRALSCKSVMPRQYSASPSSNFAISENTNQHLQSLLAVKTHTWGHHADPRRQCTLFFQRLSAWIWSSQVNHYAANAWIVVLFLVWYMIPMFHPQ